MFPPRLSSPPQVGTSLPAQTEAHRDLWPRFRSFLLSLGVPFAIRSLIPSMTANIVPRITEACQEIGPNFIEVGEGGGADVLGEICGIPIDPHDFEVVHLEAQLRGLNPDSTISDAGGMSLKWIMDLPWKIFGEWGWTSSQPELLGILRGWLCGNPIEAFQLAFYLTRILLHLGTAYQLRGVNRIHSHGTRVVPDEGRNSAVTRPQLRDGPEGYWDRRNAQAAVGPHRTDSQEAVPPTATIIAPAPPTPIQTSSSAKRKRSATDDEEFQASRKSARMPKQVVRQTRAAKESKKSKKMKREVENLKTTVRW